MYSYAKKPQSSQRKQQKAEEKRGGFIPPQITSNSMLNELASLQPDEAERLAPVRSGVNPDFHAAMQERINGLRGFSSPAATNIGIPAQMKQEFEEKSGFSFDDVRVQYNSDKPAEFGALAYTQGNQIYVGSGQEEHLEHELGHVAQQKAGMVRATGTVGGEPLNDDEGLESGADDAPLITANNNASSNIIQRKKCKIKEDGKFAFEIWDEQSGIFRKPSDGEDEMTNNPERNECKAGTVWDDEEHKWYEYNGDRSFIERREPMELVGNSINVTPYDDVENEIFGHEFKFSVWMRGASIKWQEKTDKEYPEICPVITPEDGWKDLYEPYKSSSPVFKQARGAFDKYRIYFFDDPPGIFHKANNSRKLEFNIELVDFTQKKLTIKAIQELATDDKNKITKQSFIITSQVWTKPQN